MFYKINNFVFFKNVNNYLQIIDKRDDSEIIGDYFSFLFIKSLCYQSQHIDDIVKKICLEFSDEVPFEIVKNDAMQFFDKLEEFGLVSKGENCSELDKFNKFKTLEKKEKILLPKEELEKFQLLKKENPCLQNIIVEITKKCNERCLHCYIPHENKNIMMSEEDFYNIVDQCCELNTVVNFRISGGECMSHPSFKKFIRYVKNKSFSLTVLTNLTLLDEEIIDILKEPPLSSVQVSLFSTDSGIHDKITSLKGSLEITMKNLKRLYDAEIPVDIATQAMESNKDSIEKLYKYAESYGFNLKCDWTIIAKENRDYDNLSCRICDLNKYKEICMHKINHIKGYREELKDELSRNPKSEMAHLCNAGINGLQVGTNLDIHPCPGWDYSLGNLKNTTLKEIWEKSDKLQKIRDVVLKDFPKCAKCDIRNLCSICMAQADLEMNSSNFKFEMPKYVCDMYKVIYETIKKEVLDKD